jgi:hypothetical protein
MGQYSVLLQLFTSLRIQYRLHFRTKLHPSTVAMEHNHQITALAVTARNSLTTIVDFYKGKWFPYHVTMSSSWVVNGRSLELVLGIVSLLHPHTPGHHREWDLFSYPDQPHIAARPYVQQVQKDVGSCGE